MIAFVQEKNQSSHGFQIKAAVSKEPFAMCSFIWLDRETFDALSIGQQIDITIDPIMPVSAFELINSAAAPVPEKAVENA